MRSNIRYVQPQHTAQLNRYQQRVRQLEAINESLLENNDKLGRFLHEMNDCHHEKARILQATIRELEGKLTEQQQQNGVLKEEVEALRKGQTSLLEQRQTEKKALIDSHDQLKSEAERLSKLNAELTNQNDQLKKQQQQMALKYYQSVFEVDCWAAKWAAYEEQRQSVQQLSGQYESEIVRLRDQLRQLRSNDFEEVSSSSEECRVLNDIINIGANIISPAKRPLRQ